MQPKGRVADVVHATSSRWIFLSFIDIFDARIRRIATRTSEASPSTLAISAFCVDSAGRGAPLAPCQGDRVRLVGKPDVFQKRLVGSANAPSQLSTTRKYGRPDARTRTRSAFRKSDTAVFRFACVLNLHDRIQGSQVAARLTVGQPSVGLVRWVPTCRSGRGLARCSEGLA